MIRIRCITSLALPLAQDRIAQVQQIFTENFPLPPNADDAAYVKTLDKALSCIDRFRPGRAFRRRSCKPARGKGV